jgi:hypothetical protein
VRDRASYTELLAEQLSVARGIYRQVSYCVEFLFFLNYSYVVSDPLVASNWAVISFLFISAASWYAYLSHGEYGIS